MEIIPHEAFSQSSFELGVIQFHEIYVAPTTNDDGLGFNPSRLGVADDDELTVAVTFAFHLKIIKVEDRAGTTIRSPLKVIQ